MPEGGQQNVTTALAIDAAARRRADQPGFESRGLDPSMQPARRIESGLGRPDIGVGMTKAGHRPPTGKRFPVLSIK